MRPGTGQLLVQFESDRYAGLGAFPVLMYHVFLTWSFFASFKVSAPFSNVNRYIRLSYRKSDGTFSTETHDGKSMCHPINDVT
jgi:hypothetical protein